MATYSDTIILKDGVSNTLEEISKRTDKVVKKTSNLQQKLSALGGKMKGFGQAMSLRVTAPITAAGVAAFKFASDMTETIGKTEVVFGDQADAVKKWSDTSISQMGLAAQTALDSAALYGDMATGMGLSQEQAAQMATSLTQLGADLASFKNISNDVAQTALKSIFTGETESLKNLGVVMTEVNLQEYARSQGIRKSISRMTEQEKIMLRYQYVLSRTKNAQGDFARTNQNSANQMRMLTENLKQIGVQLGQILIPIITKVLQKINEWLVKFQGLDDRTKKIIVAVGLFAAAIPPLVIALGSIATVFSVLAAHPLILTIMAIVAGLTGLYKIAEKVGEALAKIITFWDKIANADGFFGKIGAAWDVITGGDDEEKAPQKTVGNITSAQATPASRTTNNAMNMTFNTQATVREEADVDKIGQSLVNEFSLAYDNMGELSY